MIKTIFEQSDFKWMDVVYPSTEELQQLAKHYGIHRTSIQDCLEPEHLPKYEKIADVTFLITRAYDDEALKVANTVRQLTRKVAFFLKEDVLLTIHRVDQSYLVKVQDKWLKSPPRKNNPAFHIVSDLLQAIVESYEKPLNDAEDLLEKFETKIFLRKKNGSNGGFQAFYLLRRKISVYQRMLNLTQEILSKLDIYSEKQTPYLQNLRENTRHLQLIAEQLSENVNSLISLHIALESQQTNEVMRVLTLFSVFFMPLTFIVGIYGMNFEFMPELKWYYGYPAVLFSMAIVTVGLLVWFRRKGFLK